jgi:hypothetical protein
VATPWLLRAARPGRCALMTLAFVPVWDGFAAGQNALFTLFFFALAFWLWRAERGWWAGAAMAAVAVYKPHLIVGPALLFVLEVRRDPRPLLALLAGVFVLLVVDLGLFSGQSREFLSWGGNVVAGRAPVWAALRPGGELTVAAFFSLLLPGVPKIAVVLTWACTLAALVIYVLLHRRVRRLAEHRRSPRVDRTLFACATLLSLWLAPHAHLYEWTLLILPVILIWQNHGHAPRRLLPLLVGSAAILPACVRLTRVQLDWFGMAVHPALLVLLLGSIVVVRLSWGRDGRLWDWRDPVSPHRRGRWWGSRPEPENQV